MQRSEGSYFTIIVIFSSLVDYVIGFPIFVITSPNLHLMVSLVSNGIKVSVETFYQEAQSNPIAHEFVFAYRITIENHNSFSIKLLSRLWYIFDSNNERKEVEGEGVVGLQPVITSGNSFQYVSGCNLTTEMGRMMGYYLFENQDSMSSFEVKIPAFEMIAPLKMN